MNVKSLFLFAILCLLLTITCAYSYAQDPTSLDLINNAKQYDNKPVTYKGEAIGDIMTRGDHAWVHVNDGIIAIGIWAPKTMIGDISYVGDYQTKGDVVEVTGTFHRSCPEHGGDLDIHASEIKKITSGSLISRPVSKKKIRIGAYSLMLVTLIIALKKFFQKTKGRFLTS
jgi:hypothetical protein